MSTPSHPEFEAPAASRSSALALLLCAALAACSGADSERTSLIVVSLDTCRADRLSCYGATRENTPALDALAAESARFTDCVATSSLTAPSHTSLFTGQSVQRHGILDNRWGVSPPTTLASVLRDAGWRTAAFTGNGSMQAVHGVDTGFETFESDTGEIEWPFTRNLAETLPRALRWLDAQADGDAPVFLFAHGYDPHCPYAPREPWRTEYGGWYRGGRSFDAVCGPPAFTAEIESGALGEEELRWLSDLYDAEVRGADEALGGFLDALRERGWLERSIVVFLSDHGELLGRFNWVGHGMLWEEALRVPLLVRFPEGHPGRRSAGNAIDAPVSLIDVMPTVLDALGQAIPKGVQGVDLVPLLTGREGTLPELDDRMRVSRVGSQVSARFGDRWKILFEEQLQFVSGRPAVPVVLEPAGFQWLFDLQADPLEDENLFETPDGGLRFEQLLDRYVAWRREALRADGLYRGTSWRRVTPDEERELKALGYAGDDEDGEPDTAPR